MSGERWAKIIGRITAAVPHDLDGLIHRPAAGGAPPSAPPGTAPSGRPAPSSSLWGFTDAGIGRVGVRVTTPPDDPAGLAFRLAAVASERRVEPVILTTLDRSGFEAFGFRVERLCGTSPEARAEEEAELARFWDFAIVLDAAEIAGID